MICSIVGNFQLKILMAEAASKNVCSKKQVFGQTILEQPLPKNLKAEISNTILRIFIYWISLFFSKIIYTQFILIMINVFYILCLKVYLLINGCNLWSYYKNHINQHRISKFVRIYILIFINLYLFKNDKILTF